MGKSYLAAMLAVPLVLTAGSGGAAQLSAQDRTFLDNAASGGLDEVQDAQLAQEKATAPT
jgi:predicted outer membrane protein